MFVLFSNRKDKSIIAINKLIKKLKINYLYILLLTKVITSLAGMDLECERASIVGKK
jgi:hypothetical protein